MAFLRTWLAGYGAPRGFADGLCRGQAPQWGLWAVLARSALVALGLYLPVAAMGRVPPTPSYLTVLPTASYYVTLVWLTPLVFLMEWLLGGAVMHLVLRLGGRRSNFDAILNATGMASLVVGAVLVLWDWAWFAIGGLDQVALGISHLLIDVWWFTLVVTALKRLASITVGWGIAASLVALAATFPFSVLLMRSPF